MQFRRVTDLPHVSLQLDFHAASIPAAKKTCRKHWERAATDASGAPVKVSLYQRTALNPNQPVAAITGRAGDRPDWTDL